MSTSFLTKAWLKTRSLETNEGKVWDYQTSTLTKNFWPALFWGQHGRKGITFWL